ncbi:winged helix-turn-helix domain-containing protein [Streptomyces sp. NPDC018019]|uniref:winged helix-turn-helix domain-containing protein n=1 Tax=Streptomyces sp. NPDC018019 TaxID=3365030 RepID=UPI0037BDD811
MALRIHFTLEDLARTRLAPAPRPLLDVSMAIWMVRQPDCTARLDTWQREAFTRLAPPVRTLVGRHPWMGRSPDFVLTPVEAATSQEAIDIVSATPVAQVQEQMSGLNQRGYPVPGWLRRLGDDRGALRQYLGMLQQIHEHVVLPHWPQIDALAAADRALRVQRLTEGGVESMLAGLDPRRIRWDPPVLEVQFPGRLDVHLGGRGLLLVPTLLGGDPFFSLDPFNVADAEPQRWLSFSIHSAGQPAHTHRPSTAHTDETNGAPQALSALLGRTRAAVLCAIADHPGCNTTELARHTGIAPASASEHATLLRSAGLTAAARHRNMMLHTVTNAGRSFISQAKARMAAG